MADLRASGLGGVPKGNTANRPSSPSLGDVYYNGQIGVLEIYNGSAWVVVSSPPGAPSISVTDVGTSRPYGSAQAQITFSPNLPGGSNILGYIANLTNSTSSYSVTSESTSVTVTAGNGETYSIAGYQYNSFGTSQASLAVTTSLTTVPQAPTISLNSSTSSSITLDVSGNNGGKSITNYQYSTDGTTYTSLSPAQTTSPITISNLSSDTSYTLRVKAVNANGTSSASNAVTTTTPWIIEYVVVGGGAGAGGYYYTGGGGAGAMKTGSANGVNSTPYTLIIGAGGAQQNGPGGVGNAGNYSTFGTTTSYGGIGSSSSIANYIGGAKATTSSGGGGGGYGGDSEHTAGGGGGAGADGSPGNTSAGNGGAGSATSISGSSVYYGGGGGGSAYNNYPRGTGGIGGGGDGTKGYGSAALGSAGTANTGGGGGGASHPVNGAAYGYGWAGGSGVVIIKIPNTRSATFSAGVTQTLSTAVSGYKIYTVTAAGGVDTVTFS